MPFSVFRGHLPDGQGRAGFDSRYPTGNRPARRSPQGVGGSLSTFRLALPSVQPPSVFPTPTLGFKSKVFAVSTVFAAVFFAEGVFDPKKANGKTAAAAETAFSARPRTNY